MNKPEDHLAVLVLRDNSPPQDRTTHRPVLRTTQDQDRTRTTKKGSPMTPRPRCGEPGAVLSTRMSLTLTKRGWPRLPNKVAGDCAVCGAHVPVDRGCTQWSTRLTRMQVYC